MKFLLLEAVWVLLKFEMAASRGFHHVYLLMNQPFDPISTYNSEKITEVCDAMNAVCSSYYPKTVLCLQRAGAIAWMLRKRGIAAEVVIGTRKFPFQSHAWVEVNGLVINDRQGVRDKYIPIERCGSTSSAQNSDNMAMTRASRR